MLKTYYHATPKKNTFSILRKGLKSGFDGVVYLSDTVDGAMEFMRIRQQPGLFAVIPVYLDDSEVKESNDHNRALLNVNAFYYEGNISADRLEHNLDNIPLLELKWD